MNENTSAEPSLAHPKKKNYLFLWVLIGIGVISVMILWWLFGRPNEGKITKLIPLETAPLTTVSETKNYSGKYFTFSYPASYTEKSFDEPTQAPILERAFWSRQDLRGGKLALIYQDIGNFSLSEYPGYRMRTLDPKTYQSEKIEKNGMAVTLFTKNESVFEVAAFFGKKGSAVSLVASSPVALTGLREDILEVLDSWSWVSLNQEKK